MRQPHVVATLFAWLGLWAALQPPLAMGDQTNEQRIAAALEQRAPSRLRKRSSRNSPTT